MRVGVCVALGVAIVVAGAVGARQAHSAAKDNDPYLWLSDIHGAKALAWVAKQNAKSDAFLKQDPDYAADHDAIQQSLNTHDRIPLGRLEHNEVFNFWQDESHVRGLWRRTSVADYRKPEPDWETLLDVDKLDADTHADWVFHGASCSPSMKRCLVNLSPGGGDAGVIHEYDPKTHTFIDGGFSLALAKSNADYIDDDTILFATDFGAGSLTASGYPRIVKLWHRGQNIADAKTVYEGEVADVASRPVVFNGPGGNTAEGATALITRGVSFFQTEYYYVRPDGATLKLPLPLGADLKGLTQNCLIFTLRDDWILGGTTYKKGSLLAFPLEPFLHMRAMPMINVFYVPDARSTVDNTSAGRDAVYASIYNNVVGSVHVFRPASGGVWSDTKLDLPANGSTALVSTDNWSPEAYFTYESFLTPPMLYEDTGDGHPAVIKAQPALFDASGLAADQFEAISADGTQIPYFLIHAKNASGPVPTILYSYGGFELSLTPWYWNDGHRPVDAGQVWLTKGGAIAVANIRGGGEFGPAWHQAALKENRQRAFDDFAAVAKDLEARGFTTPEHLGIVGASNGGVLTTVTMTQHPELLHAVVCQRPLVDMLRYTHFGAGASWVEEYGDPDKPEDRAYLEKYSAYQNVKRHVKYPPILFITETSDDRVTPVWARMMAAKMEAQGHDVLFNEASEGGHGPGSTNTEEAEYWALSYVYLARQLRLGSSH